jgi:copper transport protein
MRARTLLLLLAMVSALLILAPARPAAAHTELESSTPSNGEVVGEPVSEITLVFTATVTPVDGGFEVLDPQGRVRQPDAVVSDDQTQILRFTEPIAGGPVGVRWVVAAADGHLIQGSFTFTVDAPLPPRAPTTTAPPTSSSPPTTAARAPAAPPVTTHVPTTTVPPTTAAAPTTTSPPLSVGPPPTPQEPIDLNEFLSGSDQFRGDPWLHRAGQAMEIATTVIAVGLVAFYALVLRGRPAEIPGILATAMVAGLIAATTAVFEAGAYAGAVTGRGIAELGDPDTVFDTLGGTYGTAIGLRLGGGILLALGLLLASPWRATIATASAAGAAPSAAPSSRWGAVPPVAVTAGALGLVVSYAFDGHTVSRGNRLAQSIADAVHVGAAAIWAGGVFTLTALAWRRWRTSPVHRLDGPDFLTIAVRFSVVAAWALLALAAAGVTMTLLIIDRPGELTSTSWGRTLLFKVAAVALAAAIGGYNRFRILPALTAAPRDPAVRDRVRNMLAAETAFLVVAVALAGLLVGAAI